MRTNTRRFALAVLAGALLAGDAGADGVAQVAEGERLYWQHCAVCHGPKGQGDGPLAGALKHPPSDLTGLALGNDGRFDAVAIGRYVDGRKRIVSHGSSEMPAWGEWGAFRAPTTGGDPRTPAERRLRDLLAYLRAIQRSE